MWSCSTLSADVALSGPLTPRRTIVSNDKCNACHGALGTTSGSNTLANAFHGGARDTVEACVVCHDANKASSTVMTNGLALNESYQFKRMIHGIHGNSKRTYPFTHGNPARGEFDMKGTLLGAGTFLADQKFTINNVSTTVIAAGTPLVAGETFETIADIDEEDLADSGWACALGRRRRARADLHHPPRPEPDARQQAGGTERPPGARPRLRQEVENIMADLNSTTSPATRRTASARCRAAAEHDKRRACSSCHKPHPDRQRWPA